MHAIGRIVLYSTFLIGLNMAQKRVLEDVPSTRKPTDAIRIPESLLMRLDSIQSVPEFLRKFVDSKNVPFRHFHPQIIPAISFEKSNETGVISSRKAAPRARKLFPDETHTSYPDEISVPYAKPAKCQPDLQVVPIQKSIGNVIFWPTCVRVKRCGGCCGGTLKACTPIQASLYNLTVIEASYDPSHPDYFQNPTEVVISVEQHTKCACTCRHQAKNCGPKQIFDEDNCHCVCRDRVALCPYHMVWDDYHCACKCREKTECSTGRYFNEHECKCQEFSPKQSFYMNGTVSMSSRYEVLRVPSMFKDEEISPYQTV